MTAASCCTQVGRSTVYVVVNVAPSLRHRREKENIFTDVEISLSQAALGGTIEVPGIFASTKVHISPGTSSHAQMCLKGKGIKRLEQPGHGDQILIIKISVPKNLAKEQKECLLKFARLEKDRQGSVDGLNDKTEVEEAGSGGDESGSGEDGKGGFKFKWFGS